MRDCWERRADDGAKNDAVIRLEIGADGGVDRASVANIVAANEGLERCIVDHALAWRFPPPSCEVTINYRFVFRTK